MTVIYEVTLHARTGIADAYLAWLHGHIAEMLALPGFEEAELHALIVDSGARGGGFALHPVASAPALPAVAGATGTECSWCVRYRLTDLAALDDYLREHAQRMRAEGIARFGDAFRAERRVLAPLVC